MTPLDLTKAPPRPASSVELPILFLARTIDKARAALPGGVLGEYRIGAAETSTLSILLLHRLGLSERSFVDMVAHASGDDDIVQWIAAHVSTATVNEWNDWVSRLTIADCSEAGRNSLFATNPNTRDLSFHTPVLLALDHEDDEGFQY